MIFFSLSRRVAERSLAIVFGTHVHNHKRRMPVVATAVRRSLTSNHTLLVIKRARRDRRKNEETG